MNFREISDTRRAINFFDPDKEVSEKLLDEMIELASKAPVADISLKANRGVATLNSDISLEMR